MNVLRAHRGAALVIVLWLVALGAILGFNYAAASRTNIQATYAGMAALKTRAGAEAGIWYAIHRLLEPNDQTKVDETGNDKGNDTIEFSLGEIEIKVAVQPLNGLADLNSASAESLLEIIEFALEDTQRATVLVDRIIDWRDRDDDARVDGAEDAEYRHAGYTYSAKNGPFNTREELELIMGISREEYEAIAPYITVFSRLKSIDKRFAPQSFRAHIDRALEDPSSATKPRRNQNRRLMVELLSEASLGNSLGRIAVVAELRPRRASNQAYNILSWRESWPIERPAIEEDVDELVK